MAKDINSKSWGQTYPTVNRTALLHSKEVIPGYTAVINKLSKFRATKLNI